MEIKFDVYFKKNLGTLCKDNEVDLDGKEAYVNIDLSLVDRLEANYSVGATKYTDEVTIKDIEAKEILIPFKSDVVKKGLNEFEIVAYMKNGDIKVSQTYTYNIEEGIGEGKQSGSGESSDGHTHSNLNILNSITQTKVNEWNNKADATHSHGEYASKNHTHNEYLTELPSHEHEQYLTEHQDISHKADKSDIYTKLETDNKISEEIAKAQLGGSGEVDLSAYATKTYVDDEISKIQLSRNESLGVSISNYEKLEGDISDAERIQRCFDENENCTIIFPKGKYEIHTTVTGKNVSMDCDAQSEFLGNGTGSVYFMFELFYDGEYDEDFKGTYNPYHYFVSRGIFNGNGIANGVNSYGGHNNTFYGCLFLDCKTVGLNIGKSTVSTSKYYINNCTARVKKQINVASSIGFNIGNSDHHIVDCSAINYTTGFYSGGGSNRFVRCHYWITQNSIKEKSKAFVVSGGGNTFLDCFLDTAKVGFEVNRQAEFTNCCGYNNRKYGLNGCTYYMINTNDSVKINGGHITDIDTNASFVGGKLPSENTDIIGVTGTDTIKRLPKFKKSGYNSSNKISNVAGYNFVNLNLNSKKSDKINCYSANINFDIVISNKEGKFKINVSAIKNTDNIHFICNGNQSAVDRIKILKLSDPEDNSIVYKFIYKPVDNSDVLLFDVKDIMGNFIKANQDGSSSNEGLGTKYFTTFNVLEILESEGTLYATEISEDGAVEIPIGHANKDDNVTEDITVRVENLSLNKVTHIMNMGETFQLVASVIPENATNKKCVFESSIKEVVAVDENGLVSAVGIGSADIIVTTEDGGKVATCSITVNSNVVEDDGVEDDTETPNTSEFELYYQGSLDGEKTNNIILEGNGEGCYTEKNASNILFSIITHSSKFNLGNYTDGIELNSTGQQVSKANSIVYDNFIEVKGSSKIVFYNKYHKASYYKIFEYDENHNFLKRTLSVLNAKSLFMTTQQNTKYLKICVNYFDLSDLEHFVVSYGSVDNLYTPNMNPLRSNSDNSVKDKIYFDGAKIVHVQNVGADGNELLEPVVVNCTGRANLEFNKMSNETYIFMLPSKDGCNEAYIRESN